MINSLIGRAIGPAVATNARDLVVLELSLVLGAISPLEVAILTMKESVFHLAAIRVTVAELAGALSVVDLAYLVVLLVVDDIARPILDD